MRSVTRIRGAGLTSHRQRARQGHSGGSAIPGQFVVSGQDILVPGGEPAGQLLANVNRPVSPPGAADRDGQVIPVFADELGQPVLQQTIDFVQHAANRFLRLEEFDAARFQAGQFAPIVHLEGSDTLLLDITGCQRLFKGEANLLHQAVDAFGHQAQAVRGAITDTPGAAWALAHAHAESAVLVPPGQGTAWLAPLPVWALRIDEQAVATLSAVGIEKIETLCHLPRGSLGPRFGDELVQRLEQALGERPELLTPYRPPTVLHSYLRFAPT